MHLSYVQLIYTAPLTFFSKSAILLRSEGLLMSNEPIPTPIDVGKRSPIGPSGEKNTLRNSSALAKWPAKLAFR